MPTSAATVSTIKSTTANRSAHPAILHRCLAEIVLFSLFAYLPVRAQTTQTKPSSPDLTELSLEKLMNMEVSSASKKEQKFSQTAAAIFVITQEDIRRSGHTSLPELLRMVPGLEVASIDANKWAISSRGFNDEFAEKMLVLIDGRTVYSPLFSGVYWDVQDTLLEDIDRIEVVRGPGATLWGANAVNGIVNVLTKGAKDTQGGLLTGGGGSQEQGFGGLRYGGKLSDRVHYRIFGKYFNRGPYVNSAGMDAADQWSAKRVGFRTDWDLGARSSLTIQGNLYGGTAGVTVPNVISLSPPATRSFDGRTHASGGNLVGRWNHSFSSRSNISLQLYYDRTDRKQPLLGEIRHTGDWKFDHHIALGMRHDFVWGCGYRVTADQTAGSLTFSFDPRSRVNKLFSAFAQDEIALVPDRLRLTLGTKVEHNDYTGMEFQPNVRLLWNLRENHVFWAAVSRAVDTPSRLDANARFNEEILVSAQGPPTLVSEFGNPRLLAETVLAYEAGYRTQLTPRLWLDLSTFYNAYGNLEIDEPHAPFFEGSPPPRHQVLPIVFEDTMRGETHGVEVATKWNVSDDWSLRASQTPPAKRVAW